MTLTILPDLIQGSESWHAARCGMVTASVVGKLLTSTLKVADNESSRGATLTLAAERITEHVDEAYTGPDMWRGHEDEPLARDAYAEHIAPVDEVGFMVRNFGDYRIGYSPDGLVGDDGQIEIKSRLQKLHLRTILADQIPAEHMAQLQCGLLVSGRDWCDFISYCGGMPLWTKRVYPDAMWFAAIVAAVRQCEADIAQIVTRYPAAVVGLPATERVEHDAGFEF